MNKILSAIESAVIEAVREAYPNGFAIRHWRAVGKALCMRRVIKSGFVKPIMKDREALMDVLACLCAYEQLARFKDPDYQSYIKNFGYFNDGPNAEFVMSIAWRMFKGAIQRTTAGKHEVFEPMNKGIYFISKEARAMQVKLEKMEAARAGGKAEQGGC